MYYEQIKAEVVKVCPEIIKREDFDRCMNCGYGTDFCKKQKGCPFTYKETESPIELHHILRTMGSKCTIEMHQDGNGLYMRRYPLVGQKEEEFVRYETTLPLAQQSEPTLKFLAELLTGNK